MAFAQVERPHPAVATRGYISPMTLRSGGVCGGQKRPEAGLDLLPSEWQLELRKTCGHSYIGLESHRKDVANNGHAAPIASQVQSVESLGLFGQTLTLPQRGHT